MKRTASIILKVLIGLVIFILLLLFTVPIIFKEKIKTKIEAVINESVNARVTFADYKLGFFKHFPNLSFSLTNLYIAGKGNFEGDTLAGFKSLDLSFNLVSLLSGSGYEVKSVNIDQAVVNAIVLKDGSANWDITKPTAITDQKANPSIVAPAAPAAPESSESGMKVLLRKVEIKKSSIAYIDKSMDLDARLKDVDFSLSGRMTLSETILKMTLKSGETTVIMDGVKYLNKAVIDSKINMLADLPKMKFVLTDNYFLINDLRLHLSGTVAMPADDIITDLTFNTEEASFKTVLSLVPAIYISGYEDLKASGEFKLSGSAIGIYSDADSSMPDMKLNMTINNGLINYPSLPEKISNINISTEIFVDGKNLDMTTVNMDKFHFELAGSPFDMSFFLKTPMSDPDFKGTMNGKIDLSALSKAIPMKGINLSGVIELAISMAGRLSMIEKEQYDSFSAKGTMVIKNMILSMAGYPRVDIREAAFLFTPAYTQIQKADIIVEKSSDFSITGNLENYIPYIFKNEKVKGNLNMHSKSVDASAIMNAMAVDSTKPAAQDTLALALIAVPKNIDFNLNAVVEKFSYENIKAENVKGHVEVNGGVLSLRETGMNILGGSIMMNADYDTRDTLKPALKADFNMKNIGVKDAYNTFMTIQKFAPAAKGIDGKINLQLTYLSLLGKDMMPVMETINGSGKLQSDQIQLLESPTFDKIKGVLKLGDKYSNTFKDINISFRINNGRVYVSPFDVKLSNIKMNISGDQGLDQTLNYLIKTEIPRSDLGSSVNSLIDNLSAQAAAFGINYKPADIIKVNVKVKGTFSKPEVSPDFGGSSGSATGAAKESVKETVKQTISSATDKGKEKLREEAAAEGDKLVKEAETKGQQLRDEAAKSAEKVRVEADSSAARLIKSAEPKGMIAKAAALKGADALKKGADKTGAQMIIGADNQAKKLVEDAKAKKEEMIKKLE